MKTEKKDRMRPALYLIVAAYESGSHTTFHSVVGDPEFERKVIQPLKEVYGWEDEDDTAVKKMKEESKILVNSQSVGKSTGAVRMLFNLAVTVTGVVALAKGAKYVVGQIKQGKKEDIEK